VNTGTLNPVSCKSVYRTLSIHVKHVIYASTAVLAVLLAGSAASAAGPRIELEHGAFKLTGLAAVSEPPGGWQPVFYVSTGPENGPPMLGSYSLEAGAVVFRPRFPLAVGARYRAVYRPPGGAATEAWFDGPAAAVTPPTSVTHVYPTTGVWPANQLRFYIYFSAPMRRGGVWRHIRLLDENGRVVPLAFLEIDQELWDPSNQRLTVLFDPGRIKRGVEPERDIGPPLATGRRYSLAVDRDLPDANGRPLAAEFRKQFRGGTPVRSAIDPQDWRLSPPPANSGQPLEIDFPRPLDYALLEHAFTVRATSDPAVEVAGAAAIDKAETRWRFTPARKWTAGDYELTVDPALEDLAGNRVTRPFEVDLNKPSRSPLTNNPARLRFHIRP
jgi:hypothetical protein